MSNSCYHSTLTLFTVEYSRAHGSVCKYINVTTEKKVALTAVRSDLQYLPVKSTFYVVVVVVWILVLCWFYVEENFMLGYC